MNLQTLMLMPRFMRAMAIMKKRFSYDQNAIALMFGKAISPRPPHMPKTWQYDREFLMLDGRTVIAVARVQHGQYKTTNVARLSIRLGFILFGWLPYQQNVIDEVFTDAEFAVILDMVDRTLSDS